MTPYDDGDRRTRVRQTAQTAQTVLHAALLAFAGFGGGMATGLGCASSDQVLERRRREEQRESGPVCTPQVSEPCYEGPRATAGRGACTMGEHTCSESGQWGECRGAVGPGPERCNGVDDDCDGEIDEDSIPTDQLACSTGKLGVCATGENRCVNGQVRCVQTVPQGAEICNKLDDDCDGRVDNACVSEAAARQQSGARTQTTTD